jgi:hypothetical protein
MQTFETMRTSQMLDTEKILVKLTNTKNHNLQKYNTYLKKMPNMVYTYCVIFCNDYLQVIFENKQFCSIKDERYPVTLELMKLYNIYNLYI